MKILLLLLLFLPLWTLKASEPDGRPNILWIISEDNGPELGCYGDEFAVTPNLDALASRGMRYENASSNAPVCAPARTTIATGIYPTSIGAQHMRSSVELPEGIRPFTEFLGEAGYFTSNNSKTDYNLALDGGDRSAWDISSRNAHWNLRDEGQPFFAVFNLGISHESQIRNEIAGKNRIHDPAGVRVPAYHPDTPEVRKDWAQYYDRITMMDAQAGEILRELEEDGLAENTIVFYFGDHGSGMPRSKRWPYRSGLQIPLIVFFPEKWQHLAPNDYEPGGSSDRLVGFIDLAPTLISLVGDAPPGWMPGRTLAGEFEEGGPDYSFGFRDRMDERYDMARSVTDGRYNYIRNYMPHRPYGQYLEYMFRTPTTRVWKRLFDEGKLNEAQALFWQTKPTEELYDLQNDPDEVNNLVDSNDPEHRDALQRLRDAHEGWVTATRDVGFLPEGEMHRRAEAADLTIYEMAQDPDLYDLQSIFEAAQIATSQDPDTLPTLISFLGDSDSGVRYWGATGLLILGEEAVSRARRQLVLALIDPNPSVAIAAAEALARYGNSYDSQRGIDTLLAYADAESNSVYDAVFALNALSLLEESHLADRRPDLQRLPQSSPEAPGRVQKYPGRILRTLTGEKTP